MSRYASPRSPTGRSGPKRRYSANVARVAAGRATPSSAAEQQLQDGLRWECRSDSVLVSPMVARLFASITMLIPLASCDLSGSQKPPAAPAAVSVRTEYPRWTLTPAPTMAGVWRLDTKTGLMDFCYFNGQAHCTPVIAAPDNTARALVSSTTP